MEHGNGGGSLLSRLLKWLAQHWKSAISAAVLVLVVVGAFKLGHYTKQASARAEPNEYMYLDSARVDSYLGQLDKGDIDKEDLQETTTENATLGLELEKVGTATGSRGSQLVRSVVVTKSEADRFYDLLERLKEHKAVLELDTDRECTFGNDLSPTAVKDGTIVLIKSATVQIPPFLSAYPELRYAGFRLLSHEVLRKAVGDRKPHWVDTEVFGRVPLTGFATADDATKKPAIKERRSFELRAGKNPRIPFSFSVPSERRQVEACNRRSQNDPKTPERSSTGRVTVVMPARFANLTGDPSLLAVPLTVVGLVVSDTEAGFGDGVSAATYWPALRSANGRLLRQLGVRGEFLKMKGEKRRRHLFGAMERSLTYGGHVLAVIPIAIYD